MFKDYLHTNFYQFKANRGWFESNNDATVRAENRLNLAVHHVIDRLDLQGPRLPAPRAVRVLVAVLAAGALLPGPGAAPQPPRRPPLLAAQAQGRAPAPHSLLLAGEDREPQEDREPPLPDHGGGHRVLHRPRCVIKN